jgi:DNA-binding NtrC family response regulator
MPSGRGIAIVSPCSERRRLFQSILESSGLRTFQAADRASALRLLTEHEISVVLSDSRLRDGDWKDFLSATSEMAERRAWS